MLCQLDAGSWSHKNPLWIVNIPFKFHVNTTMDVQIQYLAVDQSIGQSGSRHWKTSGGDFGLDDSYRSKPNLQTWPDLRESHCLRLSRQTATAFI